MSFVQLSHKLPDAVVAQLNGAEGATQLTEDGRTTIDLRESDEGRNLYVNYLKSGLPEDAYIMALFGNPIAPMVAPFVQVEVWNVINTFSKYDNPGKFDLFFIAQFSLFHFDSSLKSQ